MQCYYIFTPHNSYFSFIFLLAGLLLFLKVLQTFLFAFYSNLPVPSVPCARSFHPVRLSLPLLPPSLQLQQFFLFFWNNITGWKLNNKHA